MTYVKQVQGNLKGTPFNYTLGPKTLIVSPNASGKSRIINAVELATTGVVSDVAGRATISLEREVLELGDGECAWAGVDLDDGTALTYRVERKAGGGTARPATSRPDDWRAADVFPLRAVRDALLGSPATSRAFFLRHMDVAVDLSRELPPRLWGECSAWLGREHSGTLPSAGLPALIFRAKDAHRAKAADAKAAEKAAELLATGLVPVSERDLEDTAAEIERLERERSAAFTAAAAARPSGLIQSKDQADALLAQANDMLPKIAQAEAALASTAKDNPYFTAAEDGTHLARIQRANAVLVIADHSIDKGLVACVCCGRDFPSPAEAAQAFSTQRTAIRDLAGAAVRAEDARRAFRAECARVADLRRQWEDAQRAATAFLAAPPAPAVDTRSFDAALASARARLTDMRLRDARYKQVLAARSQLDAAQQEAATLKALVDAFEDVAMRSVERARTDFERRVQAYMPAGMGFHVVTEGVGGQEAFRLAVQGIDLKPHTALSGTEWACVQAAVACAVGQGGKDDLRIIVPEDRPFDPDTLALTLESFGRAPCQVIMASPIEPEHVPEGWTVIRLGDRATQSDALDKVVAADTVDIDRAVKAVVKSMGGIRVMQATAKKDPNGFAVLFNIAIDEHAAGAAAVRSAILAKWPKLRGPAVLAEAGDNGHEAGDNGHDAQVLDFTT